MGDIGGAFVLILRVAAFGVFALAFGVGLALWSIWLPITLWQAAIIMTIGGIGGAALVVRSTG